MVFIVPNNSKKRTMISTSSSTFLHSLTVHKTSKTPKHSLQVVNAEALMSTSTRLIDQLKHCSTSQNESLTRGSLYLSERCFSLLYSIACTVKLDVALCLLMHCSDRQFRSHIRQTRASLLCGSSNAFALNMTIQSDTSLSII